MPGIGTSPHRWLWLLLVGVMLLPAPIGLMTGNAEAEGHGAKPKAKETQDAKSTEHGGGEAIDDKKPKEGHGGGEAASPPAAPEFTLGPPLNGYYDYKVLRKSERVRIFREQITGIEEFVGAQHDWQARISVVVEFGDGSGVSELRERMTLAKREIQRVLQAFEGRELLAAEGKCQLKELLIMALNRRLRTAQVRQVYLTEFRLIGLRLAPEPEA